ncbi:hypothetical protein F2Q69_00032841 [Brassica cretica]|uniref:Catalase n=1 Tax=Brassica cretica TaxID=69181 RepID=A0A8S9SWG2_BRACR|nr:hypothetical protein F2Q69_00032841 [Brassica cretica]
MDPYKYRPASSYNSPFFTTNSGPILLEDYHLVEKLANFDRERIPERVVHARGSSAKGFFEVTHDISNLTCAAFLRGPGVQTPVIVRFSIVVHERGSPETLRDPRGFAVKFYTRESLNMFTFLFDDIGIPQDYRHMEGSGVNTYMLINKSGKAHYVKFNWKPTCGVKSLLEEDAVRVGGTNHSHATQDLHDSIAAGNYPEWKLFIQIIDPADEDNPVGRMVLNKNIDNFFAENEQLAFCPAIIVPGIHYSDDKLLQTRVFSYADTQRHRLGPNYLQLPVNAPKCAHHNNHHEGFMNFMHRDEEVNYFPSRYDPVRHAEKYPTPPAVCAGKRERCVIEKENNFKEPGERYRSFPPEKRFIRRWIEALSDPRITHEIRSIWISYWSQADKSLGQKLASHLNVRPNI